MATRSFTVFQDTPSSSDTKAPAQKPVRAPSGILTRSVSSSKANPNLPASDPAVAIDKENYNPFTGQRTSSNTANGDKKRKTTVLATKSHVPPLSKKDKSAEPESKKRKTGTVRSKPSSSSKKEPKATTSGRKAKRTSPSRRASSLPKVVEEDDAAPTSRAGSEEIAQAAINARCYELTVTPLADVSEAYEASAPSTEDGVCASEQGPFQIVKERSLEPELRDYFSPEPPSLCSLASSRLSQLLEEPEDKPTAAHAFSTPERRKIYASFTFASPSPSSKRFRDVYGSSQPASPTRPKASPGAFDSADHDEEAFIDMLLRQRS
ncbi:hypothetical protein MD484_g6285, partial [Candolleomyces efflorescens]